MIFLMLHKKTASKKPLMLNLLLATSIEKWI